MGKRQQQSLSMELATWEADPFLRMCSLAAQGLWMRLSCLAASSPKPGYIVLGDGRAAGIGHIAKMVGSDAETVENLISELIDNGVAFKSNDGEIYSKYIVSKCQKARSSRNNGKKGGRPSLDIDATANKHVPETEQEVRIDDGKKQQPIIQKPKSTPVVNDKQADMFGYGGDQEPKKKRKTQLPKGFFVPDDWIMEGKAKSSEAKIDIDWRKEAENFINHHRGHGKAMVDWRSAWRTWINNAIKFKQESEQRRYQPRKGRSSAMDNAFRQIEQEVAGTSIVDPSAKIIDMD